MTDTIDRRSFLCGLAACGIAWHTALTAAQAPGSPAAVPIFDGRTIEDFRPRHLRVVGARDVGLDAEEQATLSLLRSWRIRAARTAA